MIEIERKFLVKPEWKPSGKGTCLVQGYLSVDPERVVRIRIAGEKAYLTIKGKSVGIVRTELEYEIPVLEAEVLLKMCLFVPVEKTRYKEKNGQLTWEIDIFEGKNKGLIMAEVELSNENQAVELPDWIGEEVSADLRYFNANLTQNPYCNW